jgi:hypothetical protein
MTFCDSEVENIEHRGLTLATMGVQKKTRKFAQTKRVIGQRDARLKKNIVAEAEKQREQKKKGDDVVREVYVCQHPLPQPPTNMLR